MTSGKSISQLIMDYFKLHPRDLAEKWLGTRTFATLRPSR
jgi:hypothetical protein